PDLNEGVPGDPRDTTTPARNVVERQKETLAYPCLRMLMSLPSGSLHIETAHTPGLVCWAVLDHTKPGLSHAALDLIKVIHLIEMPGTGVPFGCDAYLRCHLRGRGKRDDPAMIHYDFKAEDVGVEVSGLGHVGRGKVGDDALDDHVRMLSASAPLHHVSYGPFRLLDLTLGAQH